MVINISFIRNLIKNEVMEALQDFASENPHLFQSNSTSMPEMGRFLTRHQTAKYLGISLSTVDLWARTGKLQKLVFNNSVRFDRYQIDEDWDSLAKYRKAS